MAEGPACSSPGWPPCAIHSPNGDRSMSEWLYGKTNTPAGPEKTGKQNPALNQVACDSVSLRISGPPCSMLSFQTASQQVWNVSVRGSTTLAEARSVRPTRWASTRTGLVAMTIAVLMAAARTRSVAMRCPVFAPLITALATVAAEA